MKQWVINTVLMKLFAALWVKEMDLSSLSIVTLLIQAIHIRTLVLCLIILKKPSTVHQSTPHGALLETWKSHPETITKLDGGKEHLILDWQLPGKKPIRKYITLAMPTLLVQKMNVACTGLMETTRDVSLEHWVVNHRLFYHLIFGHQYVPLM